MKDLNVWTQTDQFPQIPSAAVFVILGGVKSHKPFPCAPVASFIGGQLRPLPDLFNSLRPITYCIMICTVPT